MVMEFDVSFNNIPVIQWQSVVLVEETGVHGENHRYRLHFVRDIHPD